MHAAAVADAILAYLPARGVALDEFGEMWRRALDQEDEAPVPRGGKQAFPYVPISPEDYGLALQEGSLVLDIGCFAGYGLYDFQVRREGEGKPVPRLVGIDIDPVSIALGRDLAQLWDGDGHVAFCEASCEALPQQAGSVDLLIARSVLPYVDIEITLSEFARVLRTGGLALIQVHAPGYYWWAMGHQLGRPRRLGYFLRPLLSRVALGLTGRQPEHRWFRETALETKKLVELCRPHGLTPVWSQPDRCHPMVLFVRAAS